jgi:hypothetical protein
MKANLIVFHPPLIDYNVSKEVISQYDFLRNARHVLENNGINLVYFYELLPSEAATKYYNVEENFKYSNDRELIDMYYKDAKRVRELILEDESYQNSIIHSFEIISSWSIRPDNGLEKFIHLELDTKYKQMNIRHIFSCYDWHAFYIHYYKHRNGLYMEGAPSVSGSTIVSLPIETHREHVNNMWFNYTALLLSPTVEYLSNICSDYARKAEFIPFSYDPNHTKVFELQDFGNYAERENRILMSGATGSYRLRNVIHRIKSGTEDNYLRENVENLDKRHEFSELIEIMPFEKYNRYNTKHNEERGTRYLRTLSKYAGAFVCFGDFPIDFPLTKLWEIILAGCVAFIEPKDYLQRDLGLAPYVHYVPMLVGHSNKLIIDVDHYKRYLGTEEGLKIAKQGFEYIRDNFTDEKVAERYCEILKKRGLV